MKSKFLLSVLLMISAMLSNSAFGQSDTTKATKKAEKIKTGWNFGGLPVIAYDSDIGLKYGAAVNIYHYGDGSQYPEYRHSLFFEWSRTTKGSGINQFIYNSKYLIPGIRVSAEACYLTEQSLDFFGFNGYESYYNPDIDKKDNPLRMYYNMDRKLTRLKAEFQGKLIGQKLNWLAGIEYNHAKLGSVNIDKLNKDKDPEDQLKDTSLYKNYVDWGLIPEEQAEGGQTTLIKAGLVYDTRDIDANPMKGIWTELQFLFAPSFLGNDDLSYTRMVLTHRQYFTLAPKVLSFAYRLSYQAKLSGTMPYYMLPFIYNTAPERTRDGLGGAKTLRGVLRDRVVGDDFLYGNLEMRWKFLRTVVFNQNIYLALSGFLDGGMVTGKYKLPGTTNPDALAYLAEGSKEKIHWSAGLGFHFVMNENFVVAIDYGRAFDPGDGKSGLYIGFDFLY